jgi:hypothetical protein
MPAIASVVRRSGFWPFRARLAGFAGLAAAAFLLSGCNLQLSMRAEARDQWHRHYTLAEGGTLEIRNTNGVIQFEPTDGTSVDIDADRLVQAATDQAAKEGLAAFDIQETVSPDRIAIDGTGKSGINISMSRHVDYHVKAPRWANVRFTTTNGDITISGGRATGTVRAETTNGRINLAGLENSLDASTTNGTIAADVARLGDHGISASTTNGTITLTVPRDINARFSARVTNGDISQSGLNLAITEQSRRRLDGTIGTGGPTIKLETTNGAISISGKM